MSHHLHHDGSRLERDLVLDGDVAVIGTGAGGAVTAETLARAGLRVIMIEEGALRQARDFSLHEPETFNGLYFEGASRKTKDGGIKILQGRTVGGSTTVNWTATFRTPPETLQHWARHHAVKGLSADAMAPWFTAMEQRLNVTRWAVPPNSNNELLARGAEKLGWHHGIMDRNVRGCQNTGYCGFGCPVDAKMSMLVTAVPGALDAGAVLVTRTRAERLSMRNGRVDAVECAALDADGVHPTGKTVRVKAATVVVAGGGINSPALLLRSDAPDPHEVLGKRTFLHPTTSVFSIMPNFVDAFQGAPQSVYSNQFLWRGGVTGKAGYKMEVPPLHPVLAFSGSYHFGPQQWEFTSNYRYLHAHIALLRDGFHEDSPGGEVSLRDDGSPVLDYTFTDYLWEGLRHSQLSMAECQFAAGARLLMPAHMDARPYRSWAEARKGIAGLSLATPNTGIFSAHIMGGCAMGEDAGRSVVNSDGRHHQVENLYVIDGSVFPTGLGVNPQMPIYALALRNSTRLARALGRNIALPGENPAAHPARS